MIKNDMWGNPKTKGQTSKAIEREISREETSLANLKVNHILHLLLSIFTAGIWLIVWILVPMSVNSQKSQKKKKIAALEKALDERHVEEDK